MSPHEVINDALIYRYQKCKSCGNKTELTCIKCYFCYSCHKKQKTVNKHLIKHKFKGFSSSLLSSSLSTTNRSEYIHKQIQQVEPKLLVDVFGQKTEPICSYYRCRHKFSVHGLSKHGCRCKHPMNKTLGVIMRYDEE
jgi:hypothetical protein